MCIYIYKYVFACSIGFENGYCRSALGGGAAPSPQPPPSRYAHAALLSMPFRTSTLLHVFLVTHTYLYKVR